MDPSYEWRNFSLEEQADVIVAERSNCALDSSKLVQVVKGYQAEGMDVEVPEIREAYRRCFGMIRDSGIVQQKGGAVLGGQSVPLS